MSAEKQKAYEKIMLLYFGSTGGTPNPDDVVECVRWTKESRDALQVRAEAAERERDELRATISGPIKEIDNLKLRIESLMGRVDLFESTAPTPFAYNAACKALDKHRARADAAEAEIARRDAVAGEAVHLYREHNPCNGMKTDWIEIDSEQLASLKESTDPETAEFRTLHDAAPPAVLPPKKVRWVMVDGQRVFDEKAEGWNDCIDESSRLGAQPQKPVVLPEPHAHLIWIQAGRGPDDYWDDVEVSRSDKDRCCDGSERYAVYSEFEVKAMLEAANVPYEVKK